MQMLINTHSSSMALQLRNEPWPPEAWPSIYLYPLLVISLTRSKDLASIATPSSHLTLGLPLGRLLCSLAINTFFGILVSSKCCTCPAHRSRIIFRCTDNLGALYSWYISWLYLILHVFSSWTGPYILRRIFLSKKSRLSKIRCVSDHASPPYVTTLHINVLYSITLVLLCTSLDFIIGRSE